MTELMGGYKKRIKIPFRAYQDGDFYDKHRVINSLISTTKRQE